LKKYYIYETFIDLLKCNISRNIHILWDVWSGPRTIV